VRIIKSLAVIPARYESKRLPGKPLAELCGKPIIQHIWEIASKANFDDVIIATDDMRIEEKCKEFTQNVELTPPDLRSGTDRCAVVAKRLDYTPDIVVNIQCDEPMLEHGELDRMVGEFADSDFGAATLITKIENEEELFNPNTVKVILGADGRALYFSRNTIPFVRDAKPIRWLEYADYWKHIGVYAYKYAALVDYHKTEQSPLEKAERLEQLRFIENGGLMYCMKTNMQLIGIDTQADLEKARKIMGCG
jgi:3-deoxy-manno-octulosonate cytidylyltransferase (CMP-KDO synthetase)